MHLFGRRPPRTLTLGYSCHYCYPVVCNLSVSVVYRNQPSAWRQVPPSPARQPAFSAPMTMPPTNTDTAAPPLPHIASSARRPWISPRDTRPTTEMYPMPGNPAVGARCAAQPQLFAPQPLFCMPSMPDMSQLSVQQAQQPDIPAEPMAAPFMPHQNPQFQDPSHLGDDFGAPDMTLPFQPVDQQFAPHQQQAFANAKDSKVQHVQQLQQLQHQLQHTMIPPGQQQQDQMPMLYQQQQQAPQQNNWQNQVQYPDSHSGVDASDPQQLQQFMHFQRLSQIHQIQQLTQQKQQEIQELHNLQQQLQELQQQPQLPLPVPPQFNQQPFHQHQFQHHIVDGRPRPVPYQQHAHQNYVQQQVFHPVAESQQVQQMPLQANFQPATAPEDIVAHANPQPPQGNGTIPGPYVFATPPSTPDRRNGQAGQRMSANPAFMTPPTKEQQSITSRTGQQGEDTSRSVWNPSGGSNINEGTTATNGFSSIDWVIWTPSKGSAVPPSLQQQPPLLGSPNRGNASSSNEADVSGTSNNENEGICYPLLRCCKRQSQQYPLGNAFRVSTTLSEQPVSFEAPGIDTNIVATMRIPNCF